MTPVAGGLCAVLFGEGELDELFGFGEGGGSDFGADSGAVPKAGGVPGVVGVAGFCASAAVEARRVSVL